MKLPAEDGKSHYWLLDPRHEVLFDVGNYRRRRRQPVKRDSYSPARAKHNWPRGRTYHPSPCTHVGAHYYRPATWQMDSSMSQPHSALPPMNANHNNNATYIALQSPSTLAVPSLTRTDHNLQLYGQSASSAYNPFTYPPRSTCSMELQRPLIAPSPPPAPPFNFAYSNSVTSAASAVSKASTLPLPTFTPHQVPGSTGLWQHMQV